MMMMMVMVMMIMVMMMVSSGCVPIMKLTSPTQPPKAVCITESNLCVHLSQNPVCATESILCGQWGAYLRGLLLVFFSECKSKNSQSVFGYGSHIVNHTKYVCQKTIWLWINDDQCLVCLWNDTTPTVFYAKQFENLDQVAMHAELRDIDATLGISRWQPVELVMPWSSYMSCCLKEIAISQEKVPRS